MADEKTDKSSDLLSPKDLSHFLDEEITMVTKGAELRIRELTQLANAYTAGDITPEDANKRFERYQDKWGDALPGGIMMAQGYSDNEILAAIEGAGGHFTRREERRTRSERLPTNKDRAPETGV